MSDFAGRVGVVTGAARGVGRATALALARQGADCVLVDVGSDITPCPYPLATLEELQQVQRECEGLGSSALALTADVRRQAELDQVVEATMERFGRIDVLVNSAGLVGPAGVPAHEVDERDWQLLIDVNLSGSWRAAKAVAPQMMRQRSGSIVNIGSTASSVAFRLFSAYVAAKHGVIGLTKALALDYAPYGIRVNAVCPTSVYDAPDQPGMLSGVADIVGVDLDTYEATSRGLHPLGSLVYAEDVAEAALWLAGDNSARVTGTAVTVDAGFLVR